MRKTPAIERRTASGRGLVIARFVLGVVLAAGVSSAQQRPPIEPVRFSVAHRVRDFETARNRFPLAMTEPVQLGDRLVAFIQSTGSGYQQPLWSIDSRSGRASLLKEIFPLESLVYVPQPFVRLDDRLYFAAYKQGSYGPGPIVLYLWSTDGTSGGTLPLSSPEGDGFEYPAPPTLLGGNLYFFASAGEAGPASAGVSDFKLWKTDGTPMGTVAMKDVRGIPPEFVGFEGSTFVRIAQPPLMVIGGKPLFFALSGRDRTRPYGLYRLNEASEDATFLLDFTRVPGPIVELGGVGYFSGIDTYAHGQELWRTDGTPEGTRIVKDINPGGADSYPDSLTVVGETLYFSANDGVHGPELWKSDGTEAGTVLVKDIRTGTLGQPPRGFVPSNGQVFFLADDGVHGEELWRTDGTPDGTRLVKDVRPGLDRSGVAGLVPLGPWLLFSADDGAHGQELWRTDGTESGTTMIADIAPGSAASAPRTMTAYGGAVYFSADDGIHGRELWRTDGTPAGTSLAADLLPGADGSDPFVVAGPPSSLSVLAVDPGGLSLRQLASPTSELARLASLGSGTRNVSSNPSALTDVGGRLCFFTNPGVFSDTSRLWSSDGTEAGTILLATVQADAPAPIALGDSFYFVGHTAGGTGNVIDRFYRFDLNTKNLEPLMDRNPFGWVVTGQTLYFTLYSSELWKTDPASKDVIFLKKFDEAYLSLAASASSLYISVGGASPGVWKSDGSGPGTYPVWSGYANLLTVVADSLYFTSDDSLWVVAPGASSATRVQTFPLDLYYGNPASDLTAAGNSLFFLVRDFTRKPQLWRSDGTSGGTYRLSDVAVEPGSLRSAGSRAYFVAADEQHGKELWTSDGTPQGTVLVKDINPGFSDSTNLALSVIDGILLFSADDGFHGRELWRSDGTPDGTYLLDDICPDACSSSPRGFTKSGTQIFFAADDGETGSELWAMPASAVRAPPGRRPPVTFSRGR